MILRRDTKEIYTTIVGKYLKILVTNVYLLGRYCYVDASGHSKGDDASLASATLSATTSTTTCAMAFWYNMYGQFIGSLSLYTSTQYGVYQNKIWAKTDDQGQGWQKARVLLSSDQDFHVIFHAVIGVSNRGDIAIDDVIFSPSCKFNGKVLPGKIIS